MTVSPQWVVRRDGTANEVLTEDGTWGTIDEARRFETEDEANQAPRPEGTTGRALQLHPDTPSES